MPQLLHPEPLAQALGATNWCTAEILREYGESLLRRNEGEHSILEAENLFLRSMEISRKQNALAWELRSTASLARIWHHRGQTARARDVLRRVYDRFTEGIETPDLVEARALLEALQ